MGNKKLNIRFCGFGGQGIVLSSIIFGTAAVKKAGLNAVQMQSYGSEARGGECQAEVIVSDEQIESPLAEQMDVLVAMSQTALDKFLGSLKEGGLLIIDPEFIRIPERKDLEIAEIPATRIATEIGVKLAANMVMLGYIQGRLQLFSKEDLLEIISDNVPSKYLEPNIKAAESGISYA